MTPDEIRRTLESVLRRRATDDAVTVLGAGSDDLEPGRAYLGALVEGGWAVPAWPAEYGGRGADAAEVAAIARELAQFETPDLYPYLVGLHVVGPTLLARRVGRAAGAMAAADRVRRRDLVPALQRTRSGLRPREPGHASRA